MLAPGPGPGQYPKRRQQAKQKRFGVKAGQKPDQKEVGRCPLSSKLNYAAAQGVHFVPAIEIYGRSDDELPTTTFTDCPVCLSTTIRSPSGSLS